MSSGSAAPEMLLSTPLPCWHESLHAARTDLIVGLSPRRARIASGRPVPVGMPVFLELGHDAGIDAIAVASDADAFVVEFIAIDDAAAALIESALQPTPTALPRTRTDELGLPADAPIELPAFAVEVPVALPPTERTGEFLAADIDGAIAERTAEAATATPIPLDLALPVEVEPAVVAPLPPPTETGAPSWVRAFDADLGDEPELPPSGHTQRWPTAQATSSEAPSAPPAATPPATTTTPPGWLGEVTPEPHERGWADGPRTPPPGTAPGRFDDGDVATARWPAARVARVATPPMSPATTTPPGWLAEATPEPSAPEPVAASPVTTTTTATPAPTPTTTPADETARWPVARVAVAPTAPSPAADVPVDVPTAAAAAPPLSFEDAEDVMLEFTAPPRPAVVTRPLPPPEDEGVVEVDFSEFRDVLGVATFKAVDERPTATGGRISTPQPVSITLPRTPSTSHAPQTPARNPFAGDSGVGPRPDSTPPVVPEGTPVGGIDEQWVVSSPSLPAPRLLDRGLDRVLRSGGPNSVTPQPLPFIHDSTPPPSTTTPAVQPATATTPPLSTPAVPSATTSPMPPVRPIVPPPTPVLAPRPPPLVPVVPPRPPVVVAPPPARPTTGIPAVPTTPAVQPAAVTVPVTATTPPISPPPVSTPVVAPATSAAPEPPAITVREEDVVTAPGGGVQVLPLTSSAEDLPLVLGDGEDVDLD